MITARSNVRFHFWAHLPGCIAELRHDDGRKIGTIHSREIGDHQWLEASAVFASLHDAMRAVERSAAK